MLFRVHSTDKANTQAISEIIEADSAEEAAQVVRNEGNIVKKVKALRTRKVTPSP